VREEADKRIESELRRHAGLKREQFENPRRKLDYCNVTDYLKLIRMQGSWSHFKLIIRRELDVERHVEAFADFRNAIMHNRPLTELSKRAGELAIVWLETIMPDRSEQESDREYSHETE
jgi:hypothetical protein